MQLDLDVPMQFSELFNPTRAWRHLCYHGGRSSAKSTSVALSRLISGMRRKERGLCTREIQGSIADSVHRLLSDLIAKYNLNTWQVQEKIIYNTGTGSEIIFKGLHNNTQSIKSTEGLDWAWVEEAQSVSDSSIRDLVPTVRKPGSIIIWTFNRLSEEDAVWTNIVQQADDKTLVIKVNSDDVDDILSDEVRDEREKMRLNNPEMFEHVWLGEPLTTKTGSVFGKQLARAREDGRIGSVPYDASYGVYTAWDLGVSDSTAIWFFQIVGKELRFIDHYESSGEDLGHYVGVIQARGYRYTKHFLPHDANHRELQTNMTRVEFFAQKGINNVEVLRPTNFTPGQDDIDLVARPKLSICWFDAEKCKRGLECLRAYHYEFDEKNNLLKKKPEHDWSSHTSSAFIYAMIANIEQVEPMNARTVKTFTPSIFQQARKNYMGSR